MEDILARLSTLKLTVVLIGSTGSLGSYLLDCLLGSTQISKVFCLNRGSHGEDRQRTLDTSGGWIDEWGDRVEFMTTELGKPRLELLDENYNLLVREASIIIRTISSAAEN